ncbi:MAG TPA: SDR family NAD(P)-dependent oxidoreductase [Solirubrobacterales bacterium]|nr:SDR family NAD(P)-dependent oxidoreductase [Solirubrobacterales bacterium]
MSPAPTPLAGRTAVISGAASGIGRALAVRLSSFGCPLALIDVDEAGLEETVSLVSTPVLARRLDVSDRGEQLAFAAEVADWAPAPLGAVFNNAGVALAATVEESSTEDEEWLRRINLEGVIHGTHAYLPILRAQGSGAIVNTSSVFGLAGIPGQSAYCASKFAVRGFTESLRHELVGSGLRAVTIHPGGVKTNIARNGRLHSDPKGLGRTKDEIADEFEAFVRTTPERAAEVIHRGLDAGKARILIGPDAYIFDLLTRVTPTHYYRVLGSLERLVTRSSRS